MGSRTTRTRRPLVLGWMLISLLGVLLIAAAGCGGKSHQDQCQADPDCPYPQVCLDGVCIDQQPECTSDADCPASARCAAGRCIPRDTGCVDDGDCEASQRCVAGRCQPDGGCRSDQDCTFPETCENGVCVDETDPPSPLVLIHVLDDPAEAGFTRVEFEVDESIVPFEGIVTVDDKIVAQSEQLRPLTVDTSSFNDGLHRISLRLSDQDGVEHVGWTTFEIRNPTIQVLEIEAPEYVYPGMEIEIFVTTDNQAADIEVDFSTLVPGFDPSAVQVAVGDPNRLTYTLPADLPTPEGHYLIPVWAEAADGTRYSFGDVGMFLGSGPLLPFEPDRGVVELGSLRLTDDPGAKIDVVGLQLDGSFEAGGKLNFNVQLSGGDLTEGELLLSVTGYGGYISIPLASLKPLGGRRGPILELGDGGGALACDGDGPAGGVEIKGAVRDGDGKTGGWATGHTERVVPRENLLKVSLKWEAGVEADLDLHVIEPDGEEIYWNSPQSDDTGILDIDSNTDCNFDGRNREVIVWSQPPLDEGDFIVKVDYYMRCDENLDFKYWIEVEGCDADYEGDGRITAAMQPDQGGAGAGFEVHRFSCPAYNVVEGQARYLFHPRFAKGMKKKKAFVRGVQVGVIDAEKKTLIGDWGTVGKKGKFKVYYPPNPDGPQREVMLRFRAIGEEVWVWNPDANEYHVYDAGPAWIPEESGKHKLDALIPIDKAGPFHICKKIRKGMLYFKNKFPNLSLGLTTTEVHYPAEGTSAYFSEDDYIDIQHDALDADEFEDSVILHELGHRVMAKMSRDDSAGWRGAPPAGHATNWKHYWTDQLPPEFAWSEGIATYLGQVVIGDAKYCTRDHNSGSCDRIDDRSFLEDHAILGTKDRRVGNDSNHSEFLVAALMWDLTDPKNAAESDGLKATKKSVLTTVFRDMVAVPDIAWAAPDSADLADFIHNWGCFLPADDRDALAALMDERYSLQWMTTWDDCRRASDPVVELAGTSGIPALLNEPSAFTIIGNNIEGVWFALEDCVNVSRLSATSDVVEFQCTPTKAGPNLKGEVWYSIDEYSTIIHEFTVNVSP